MNVQRVIMQGHRIGLQVSQPCFPRCDENKEDHDREDMPGHPIWSAIRCFLAVKSRERQVSFSSHRIRGTRATVLVDYDSGSPSYWRLITSSQKKIPIQELGRPRPRHVWTVESDTGGG